MTHTFTRLWREDDGVLSFEWTLLVTLLTFGIVAGISAARDAIIDEFGDAAQAMLALDQSMTIDFPLQVIVHDDTDISSASDSSFVDAFIYTDCDRLPGGNDQSPHDVTDDDS
jgi:Flp pilus assembly pilin Flp